MCAGVCGCFFFALERRRVYAHSWHTRRAGREIVRMSAVRPQPHTPTQPNQPDQPTRRTFERVCACVCDNARHIIACDKQRGGGRVRRTSAHMTDQCKRRWSFVRERRTIARIMNAHIYYISPTNSANDDDHIHILGAGSAKRIANTEYAGVYVIHAAQIGTGTRVDGRIFSIDGDLLFRRTCELTHFAIWPDDRRCTIVVVKSLVCSLLDCWPFGCQR